uniref:WAPL domain-containing protein n=2 Tax=Parascaris univalens TaxID=6257 RepID=A0A914ZMH9_PARUN
SQSSGAKVTRRFGHFSSDPNTDKAASLFDSVYPRQANTSNQPSTTNLPLKRNSPKKVELPTEAKSNSPSSTTFSSPTASIPDIGLEKSGSSGSDEDEDEAQGNSQSSSASLNNSMKLTSISDRDIPGDSRMKKPGMAKGVVDEQQSRGLSVEITSAQKRRQNKFPLVFEEEEEEDLEDEEEEEEITPPQIKRTRSDPVEQATSSEEAIVGDNSLFSVGTKKENKPVYKHKWAFDDEEDEEAVADKDESQRNKVIVAAFCFLIVI